MVHGEVDRGVSELDLLLTKMFFLYFLNNDNKLAGAG